MTMQLPMGVSQLASQYDLGIFQKRHIPRHGNLPYILAGGFFFLFSLVIYALGLALLISVSPDDWGSFSPLGALILGSVILGLGALFFFPSFFSLAYQVYEYSGGLLSFNKKKPGAARALRWSEIESVRVSYSRYSGANYYAVDSQGRDFSIPSRGLWKRCEEAAARNYEINRVMRFNAEEGTYRGSIKVARGKGRRKNEKVEKVIVYKRIYEDELVRVGRGVEQSDYWLPRCNGATVYLDALLNPSVTSWVLGNNPAWANVPPDTHPTLEQIMLWAMILTIYTGPLDSSSYQEEAFRQRFAALTTQSGKNSDDPTVRAAMDSIIDGVSKALKR